MHALKVPPTIPKTEPDRRDLMMKEVEKAANWHLDTTANAKLSLIDKIYFSVSNYADRLIRFLRIDKLWLFNLQSSQVKDMDRLPSSYDNLSFLQPLFGPSHETTLSLAGRKSVVQNDQRLQSIDRRRISTCSKRKVLNTICSCIH